MKQLGVNYIAVFLLTLFFAAIGYSQKTWDDENTRRINYPSETWYTGIGYGVSADAAQAAAKKDATSKIMVSVSSHRTTKTVRSVINDQNGWDEEIVKTFDNETSIDVAVKDICRMECDVKPSGSQYVAFAYVKKQDLIDCSSTRLNVALKTVETILDVADDMVKHGDKMNAREKLQSAEKYFAEWENAQRILLAVNEKSNVQLDKALRLAKHVSNTLLELKNATSIYLECNAVENEKPYVALANDVKSSLSKLGVNFVSDKKSADWIISVNADVVRNNTIHDMYFVWIDGDVSVQKTATDQVVYSGSLSDIKPGHQRGIKGGDTNYHDATREAYKEVSKILSEKLYELINN